jgi:hypothetical protein
MTAAANRTTARPRFAWLLWFALLLPLAQAFAWQHAQSHWDTEQSSSSGGKHAILGDHCDLCVAAATVAAGGAASTPLRVAPGPVRNGATAVRDSGTASSSIAAYQSRAPPFVSD